MTRKELISEIADFCFDYEIFDEKIKDRIENELAEISFIESLICTIIIKTKNQENADTKRIKKMLLELEKMRLDLEFPVN